MIGSCLYVYILHTKCEWTHLRISRVFSHIFLIVYVFVVWLWVMADVCRITTMAVSDFPSFHLCLFSTFPFYSLVETTSSFLSLFVSQSGFSTSVYVSLSFCLLCWSVCQHNSHIYFSDVWTLALIFHYADHSDACDVFVG